MGSSQRTWDVAVVGGGILGLATAMALSAERQLSLVVLEAEGGVARHQTGHNSGVIHSGLYYSPGSLKAKLSTAGRVAMYRFCEKHEIPHRRTGKLVIATEPSDIGRLDELEQRGRHNGLKGLERLDPQGIREHEPAATGLSALWVPETGIVDYRAVARAMAATVERSGGEIRTDHRLRGVRVGEALELDTTAGPLFARHLVNCAGLQCDRVATMCGAAIDVRIVPFRGEYFELEPEARRWVRGPIYPVPNPAFPFLGVHFTPTLDGRVEAGPNAVLALRREGYSRVSFSARDTAATLAWPGFWRLASGELSTGLMEFWRSLSKTTFAASLARLVPGVEPRHLRRAGTGVRAQAVDRAGRLLDDFAIVESEHAIHVLNAPSPGATASLAIGEEIARRARRTLGL